MQKLRIKNYSPSQLDYGANGSRRKMGVVKWLLSINEIRPFIAFLRPIFESLEATYHNKQIVLIFWYFVLLGINFAKLYVSARNLKKWRLKKCPTSCVLAIRICCHTPYKDKVSHLCGSFHVPLQSESVATHLTMERFSPVWILSCVLAIRICCHTPYNHKVSLLCGSFHVSWPFESIATHLTMVSFLSWVSHLVWNTKTLKRNLKFFSAELSYKSKGKKHRKEHFSEKKITQP